MIRKNHGIETEEIGIQKFLAVYRITPNPNANLSPAEIMFAHKILSVFDRILPSQEKKSYTKIKWKGKKYKVIKFSSEITMQERVIGRVVLLQKESGEWLTWLKKKDLSVKDTLIRSDPPIYRSSWMKWQRDTKGSFIWYFPNTSPSINCKVLIDVETTQKITSLQILHTAPIQTLVSRKS